MALAVVALLALVGYPSAYLALVQRDLRSTGPYGDYPMEETYRVGGGKARVFFLPLNVLDRKLRPEYWGGDHTPMQWKHPVLIRPEAT